MNEQIMLDNIVSQLTKWLETTYIVEVIGIGYAGPEGSSIYDLGWSFKFNNQSDEIDKIKGDIESNLKDHNIFPGDQLYLICAPVSFLCLSTRDKDGNLTEGYGWFSFYSDRREKHE